jgi:hypothetical protein
MKNSYKIVMFVSLAIFIGLTTFNILNAQPPFKAKERIEQLKKIKLLDVLELDEERSTKFLSKYNELDRASEEKRLKMQHEVEVLELLIKTDAKKEEITEQTKKVIKAQQEYHESVSKKMTDIKPLLDEIEYAKFVVFESRFHEEVRKIIMKNYRNRHEGRNQRGRDIE